MSFTLSSDIKKNMIYLVKASELKERFDPLFYHPKYLENEKKIKSCCWGYDNLGHLANRVIDGPFGSDLKVDEYQISGIPLLRVSNIKTGEVEGNIVYISDEKQKQLIRSKVNPGDVLLTKAGAILGYSAVFPKELIEGNITSHLVTISCKEEIDPYYLSYFLRSNIGQLQIYRWGNKSTRPELNTGEVKKILIPIPPMPIQEKIIAKMQKEIDLMKSKEVKARQLLDGIDDYLLKELNIQLPNLQDDYLNIIFKRKMSNISGKRIDPRYYKQKFISFNEFLDRLDNVKTINDISSFVGSGSTPKVGGDDYTTIDDGVPFIRIVDLKENTVVVTDSTKYIKPHIHDGLLRRTQLQPRDVLLTMAGTIGLSVVVPNNLGPANINQAISRITIIESVDPFYVSLILNSKIGMIQTDRISRPSVQANINLEEIKSIRIPLPSLEKQIEITKHVNSIYRKVNQMNKQALKDFQKKINEIETMILGEAE